MTTALLALSLAAGCTSNPQTTPSNATLTRSNGGKISNMPVQGSAGTLDEGVAPTVDGATPSTFPASVPIAGVGTGGTTTTGPGQRGSTAPTDPAVGVPSTTSRPVATTSLTVAPAGPSDDVWYRLAQCESGVRNLRNAPYSGYFQFLPSTWRSLGLTGEPADHSYEEQKAGAIMLQARSGWGQWPACSRKLGLR